MDFLTSYYWETGTRKRINQDSLCLQKVMTRRGRVVMACICDGLGGLEQGEVASGYVTEAVSKWFYKEFMQCIKRKTGRKGIEWSGRRVCRNMNQSLCLYGKEKKVALGTTATILVIWGTQYGIFHIGDSRVYVLNRHIRQVTKDHAMDEHTLTRCLGMTQDSRVDFIYGHIRRHTRFLLCSDGFRHYTEDSVFHKIFAWNRINEEEQAYKSLREIGKRNMKQGEQDNISAIYIQVIS
ncbi:MAG: protein phosphatase 2C domain-containing protein [Lachnospiraceae bacterium]